MITYNLWDTETNNLIGHYLSQQEALLAAKSLIENFGTEYADELSLSGRNEHGALVVRLTGVELAVLALLTKRIRPAKAYVYCDLGDNHHLEVVLRHNASHARQVAVPVGENAFSEPFRSHKQTYSWFDGNPFSPGMDCLIASELYERRKVG